MRFHSRSNGPQIEDHRALHESTRQSLQAGKDYANHLQQIGPRLPSQTKVFALASWYHDPKCHDCPHDSWLMNLTLVAGTEAKGVRPMNLTITLLGAYHDRILTFKYTNVVECSFEIQNASKHNVGDWLFDEFDILGGGFISHEILWQHGKPWKIVAEFIEFSAKEKN